MMLHLCAKHKDSEQKRIIASAVACKAPKSLAANKFYGIIRLSL